MKLAHIIFSARYSGAEILARDLALQQRAKGLEVSVVAVETGEKSFAPELDRLARAGVTFVSPAQKTHGALRRVAYLRKVLKSLQPDLVIAHSILPSFYSRAVKVSGQRFRVATVLHTNSDFHDLKLRWTERAMRLLNDAVIGVSKEACAGYNALIGKPPSATLIPNGIDLQRFRFDEHIRTTVRKNTFGVQENERVILQVGRICEQKQQLLTLQALRHLNKTYGFAGPIKMIFVGTTERQAYTTGFFHELKEPIKNITVSYLGPRSDVDKLLMASDLCVIPSGWEAHSIAAVEAAASGISMIVSDISAFGKLIGLPGISSFRSRDAYSLSEAIHAVLTSEQRARFDRALMEFSIERCSDDYLSMVQRMAGSGS